MPSSRRSAVALLSLLSLAACSGEDPGRNVERMADPLAAPAAAPVAARAPSDTLATDSVRKSQAAAVSQRVADTEIVVTYSRPVARGRELFGALVEYGKVWNPGADRATAVRFARDVELEGRALSAGAYSLWVIPNAATWTVIFNRAADVYHVPYPGEASDALRIEVPTAVGAHAELLTFEFPLVEGKRTTLRMAWGTTRVDMAVRVP